MDELKPCKFAEEIDAGEWECTCFRHTQCYAQEFDYNPDGSVNIVMCGYRPEDSANE